MANVRNVEAERLSRLGFIFTYALSSWQNRPDYFGGFATLARFGKECDHVLNGGEPHDQEWMDDPNGKFWDALPTPEPNGYTARPDDVLNDLYEAVRALVALPLYWDAEGRTHEQDQATTAAIDLASAALKKAQGGVS